MKTILKFFTRNFFSILHSFDFWSLILCHIFKTTCLCVIKTNWAELNEVQSRLLCHEMFPKSVFLWSYHFTWTTASKYNSASVIWTINQGFKLGSWLLFFLFLLLSTSHLIYQVLININNHYHSKSMRWNGQSLLPFPKYFHLFA